MMQFSDAIHVKPPPAIPKESPKYDSFTNYVSSLKASLNLTVDPCENFYEYSCSAFNAPISFSELSYKNYDNMITALKKEPVRLDFYLFWNLIWRSLSSKRV